MPKWVDYLDGKPRVTRATVLAAAKDLGFELPPDYLSDLLKHGGKGREAEELPLESESLVFGLLLPFDERGFNDAETYTISDNQEALTEWFAMADREADAAKFWPFASDTAQGLYCFRIEGGADSEIVFIDMDGSPEDPTSIVRVAASYAELLERLV